MQCSVCKQDRQQVEQTAIGSICASCLSTIFNIVRKQNLEVPALTKALTPQAQPERKYYKVRINQFVTIVDARDVDEVSGDIYAVALRDPHQPWYIDHVDNEDNTYTWSPCTSVDVLTYSEYCDWLRRSE